MTTAAITVADLPAASDCLCCQNGGVLPAANDTSGLVDRATIVQCCRDCVAALFLDASAGWLFLLSPTCIRFAR